MFYEREYKSKCKLNLFKFYHKNGITFIFNSSSPTRLTFDSMSKDI